jgi:ComF family protein
MRLAGLRAILPLLRDVVDFCYPGRCAVCEDDCAGGAGLCPACLEQLVALEAAPACEWCGKPLAAEGDPCPWCLGKGMPSYHRVAALGAFRDPIKHLIHRVKYHRRWTLAEYLAGRLLDRGRVRRVLAEADCIVPVPLHRLRQMSRGYNQADVLARALARAAHRRLPVVYPAVRWRHTETQTHQHSRERREENLRDAFGLVRPEAVRGRRVVVVDDVLTTGATVRSLARALRPARPARLSAIVLAMADPKGFDFRRV